MCSSKLHIGEGNRRHHHSPRRHLPSLPLRRRKRSHRNHTHPRLRMRTSAPAVGMEPPCVQAVAQLLLLAAVRRGLLAAAGPFLVVLCAVV